jgi:CRP-like cAMP-binding protein
MDRIPFESALTRSPLFSGMQAASRASVVKHFVALPFLAGDPIIRAGDPGRHLGVLVSGAAAVQARRHEHAFTVELLDPGRVFGEIAFFDAQSTRTADIVGIESGTAALLTFQSYADLVRDQDPAATVLEKNILDLLGRRIHATNQTLAELLESTQRGTFLDTLRQLFGGRR